MARIPFVTDRDRGWRERRYDIGLWWCGYEKRSTWLVNNCRPRNVEQWYRIEPREDRDKLSAPSNLGEERPGILACGGPLNRNWDGSFRRWWGSVIEGEYNRRKRPLSVFIDYSSMPRTVYGQVVIHASHTLGLVKTLSMAYVPGRHAPGVDGSRRLDGLRPLIGTEGATISEIPPAAVVGLGFDGSLAYAAVELFQIDHVSCVLASPGTTLDAMSRALKANESLMARSEVVKTAPASSVAEASVAFLSLARWHLERRGVMLLPLGPKPHVLG